MKATKTKKVAKKVSNITLRDVMFVVHPKPANEDQAQTWRALAEKNLNVPDTWETALSAGMDKKQTFERLLKEGKLGGLACLRNLRNMVQAKVSHKLIADRLGKGIKGALPFQFLTAARECPALKAEIGEAMLKATVQLPKLPGKTLFVLDLSGSMGGTLSMHSTTSRIDAAVGLGILAIDICEDVKVYATAGSDGHRRHATAQVPNKRGLDFIDEIRKVSPKIGSGGIFFVQCLDYIAQQENANGAPIYDRVFVVTDEQDCDQKLRPDQAKKLGKFNYVLNIAPEKNGISYQNGWEHIDGWSERVFDYVAEVERTFELA